MVLIVLGTVPVALADNVRLSVNTTGLGAALELVPPGRGLGCTTTRCDYEFARGTMVAVTARPIAPASFARWRGLCHDSTSATCRVLMSQDRALTGRFSPVALYTGTYSRYEGTVSVNPPGSSCGAGCWAYPYATRVTVTAEPASNRAFGGWFGPPCAPAAGNVCGVSLFDNVDALARFPCTGSGECIGQTQQPIERYVSTSVTVIGPGSVQIGRERCTPAVPCRLDIKRGSVVTMRADGSRFTRWSGSCAGTSQRCQMSALRDANGKLPNVIARFRPA